MILNSEKNWCKCYQTQVWLLAARKPVLKRQVLVEKGKVALFRSLATWGKGGLMSKNKFWRFCSTIKFLKGESFGGWVRVFVFFHYVQTFFWLVGGEVTGQCSRNLVLSLKLPSSTWVEALVPTEELKGITYIPWGGTRTLSHICTIASWLLLLCFCIPSLPW